MEDVVWLEALANGDGDNHDNGRHAMEIGVREMPAHRENSGATEGREGQGRTPEFRHGRRAVIMSIWAVLGSA